MRLVRNRSGVAVDDEEFKRRQREICRAARARLDAMPTLLPPTESVFGHLQPRLDPRPLDSIPTKLGDPKKNFVYKTKKK
jgi:hypothetical protein